MAPSADSPTPAPPSSTEQLKHMQHHPRAQQTFSIPLIAHENAFLGDVFSSEATLLAAAAASSSSSSSGKEGAPLRAPISAGFFRLEPGTPLEYTYTYDEMKIVVEGEFQITDTLAGQTVTARPGDVFFFPKGAEITFVTSTGAKAFYCGQRKEGAA